MLKFITAIIGKWRNTTLGGFKTAPINFFNAKGEVKIGAELPIEEKLRESDNQFAWIVQYEKT